MEYCSVERLSEDVPCSQSRYMRTSVHHKIWTILRRMYQQLSKLPGNLLTRIKNSMFKLDITLFTLRYITTTTNFLDVSIETLNYEYQLASYIICGSLIFVETVRRESLICTGNHKLERWKYKAHMGIMIGYILLANLIPQIVYHMLLSYPPTISSKSTYSFLIRMD